MLYSRPFAHVGADLTQYFLDSQCIHAIDLGQIYARQAVQGWSQVKGGRVLRLLLSERGRRWCAEFFRRVECLLHRFQLGIAFPYLTVIEIIQFYCLLKDKQVFALVASF